MVAGGPKAGARQHPELPADLVLLALGYTGPEPRPGRGARRASSTTAARVAGTPSTCPPSPGSSSPVTSGRGQSLIVWAIAEGRAAAGAVDDWLTGNSMLPRPVTPDAVRAVG